MKSLIAIAALILTVQAHAAKLYLVEPMNCIGQLATVNTGMHPDYKKSKMTFTSFVSTRRDGSLANSLEIATDSTSNYYLSPLFIDENHEITKKLGAYDETLKLKVVSSELSDDNRTRTDVLKGTLTAQGTVVGNTVYSLVCKARVVQKVKRIDNATVR